MTDLLEQTDQNAPQEQQEQATNQTDLLGSEQETDEQAIVQKRLNDSQAFIETLKSERQLDRERIEKMEQELEALRKSTPTLEEAVNRASVKPNSQGNDQPLDVDSVTNTVLEKLKQEQEQEAKLAQQKEQESLAEQTYTETTQKIVEQYGDANKAKEVLSQKLQEKGISMEKARVMMSDPEMSKLVLDIASVSQAKSTNLPLGSVNTSSIKPAQQEDKLFGKTSKEIAAWMEQRKQNLKGN